MTRSLVRGAAFVGLLASARYAVDPPRPVAARAVSAPGADLAAQGFATLFTRRYLTWDASSPDLHRRGLAAFAGDAIDPDVGMRPPPAGRQSVLWAQVVQARPDGPAVMVYTVAAETDAGGLTYLTVPVRHPKRGAVSLAGFPAFVGAPAAAPEADAIASLPDVHDRALSVMTNRALGNYLAGTAAELAADLTSNATVSLPPAPLSLQGVDQLKWTSGGASVIATVRASGADGTQYTLDYELDVARVGPRWEISAIQMDPNV